MIISKVFVIRYDIIGLWKKCSIVIAEFNEGENIYQLYKEIIDSLTENYDF